MGSREWAIGAVRGLAMLGALVSASFVSGCVGEDNLVLNGGFEARQDGKDGPASWVSTPVPVMREFFDCEWDSVVFRSGHRSASISIQDHHPDRQVFYNWNQAPLDCRPGETYEITGWIKAEGLEDTAVLAVQCWDTGMKKVLGFANTQDAHPVVGTTDWVEVQATFDVPADTWRVVVLAAIPGHSNPGGRVWFDDIAVVRVGGE